MELKLLQHIDSEGSVRLFGGGREESRAHQLFDLVWWLFPATAECQSCGMNAVGINNSEQALSGRLLAGTALVTKLNGMPQFRNIVPNKETVERVPNLRPMKRVAKMCLDEALGTSCCVFRTIIALGSACHPRFSTCTQQFGISICLVFKEELPEVIEVVPKVVQELPMLIHISIFVALDSEWWTNLSAL